MGLFDKLTKKSIKKNQMPEDEALTILMEGTAPIKTLENAYKSLVCLSTTSRRCAVLCLYHCLGKLCGLEIYNTDNTAIDEVFGFLIMPRITQVSFEEFEEGMKLLGEIYRRHPDFNREVNEFALNEQPDSKYYSKVAPYLSLAHLYGWGYEPDVQQAEEYADKAEALEKNEITENLRACIEAVKNGQ